MYAKGILVFIVVVAALVLSYGMLEAHDVHSQMSFVLLWVVILGWILYEHYLRKRDEKRWLQMQKMESIGRLAGGIAHDFNNMLTGILGAAEAIDMKTQEDSPVRNYTAIIKKASERLASLTSELLVFAREKDRKIKDFHLNNLVADTVRLLTSGLEKNYKIVSENDAEADVIEANQDLVQSLMLNMAVNAKDAMSDGGIIRFQTRNVALDKRSVGNFIFPLKDGKYIELMIQDSGSGIPAEIQPKIFEPFFTTKDVGQGTGLGLAAAYGIIRKYKGNLRFETSKNGTSFYIYFPVTEHLVDNIKPTFCKRPLSAKILAVDDEKILLELLKDIMENMGAKVTTINNPAEALPAYLSGGEYNVVMLDVVMPEISGLEIYEELRKQNKELKIVLMSGYSKDKRIEEILARDSNCLFISKPYSLSALSEVMQKLNLC